MTTTVAVVLVLVTMIFSASSAWVIIRTMDREIAENARLARELTDAHNRLYAAWTDGKVIPPSDLPFVDPVSETPLPPELLDYLMQYEDVTVRGKYERMMRAGLAKQMSPLAILKTFEQPGV